MTTRGLMGWSSWGKFERNLQEDFAQASAMPPIPQLAQIFATCISPLVMTVFVDFLKCQLLHHSFTVHMKSETIFFWFTFLV